MVRSPFARNLSRHISVAQTICPLTIPELNLDGVVLGTRHGLKGERTRRRYSGVAMWRCHVELRNTVPLKDY